MSFNSWTSIHFSLFIEFRFLTLQISSFLFVVFCFLTLQISFSYFTDFVSFRWISFSYFTDFVLFRWISFSYFTDFVGFCFHFVSFRFFSFLSLPSPSFKPHNWIRHKSFKSCTFNTCKWPRWAKNKTYIQNILLKINRLNQPIMKLACLMQHRRKHKPK